MGKTKIEICDYCHNPAIKYDKDCEAWMCQDCLDEIDDYLRTLGLKKKKGTDTGEADIEKRRANAENSDSIASVQDGVGGGS